MKSKRLSECTYGELKEILLKTRRKIRESNVTGGGESYATPKAFGKLNKKKYNEQAYQ